ncbi:MAG: hypothetical protein Q8N92_03165 [Erysipelotrichaceae bacterium]|nr:hypothetical protein [Erysipelotrichaceae bacterium]
MRELIQFGTYLAFIFFVSWIVYSSVKFFGVAYKKNEFIENHVLKFVVALFFSIIYGVAALFGGIPTKDVD